ncbi:penicillin-binding protein, 1A family [Desulfosporosinus orientis DSM 765]|uniref:Penicillin-binding protein 1A n=1 Tax=Desulfosporosinus orientis (strain ATCC 19365 / DSM 765 / NCIMB 8382 / VKM B-1628 / Singapore I) TaxID=768706 RepID=G7WFA2_DESOD|nr:PBP1A family penicillin-binding protein [Desulfosporosinus orientis]AET67988.1 penicillin-binding protein, 1A family [Desulfosporosinus orientis DSM 765]
MNKGMQALYIKVIKPAGKKGLDLLKKGTVRIRTTHFWRDLKFWKRFFISFTAFLFLSASGFAIYVSTLDVSKLQSPLAQPTYIYDRYGNKVSELSSSKIDPVLIDKIPKTMQQAIVATEDRRFYQHQGVDVWSIFRALVHDLRSGDFSEGGSTITQQLAKNMFLPSDKTLSRKFKEAAYAFKIELTLSKDQILEEYLNQIYFGEGRWGIQNAAQYYFGKNVQDLNLAESAMLAGLPKAPSLFNPVKDKEKALERRNVVLSLMKEQNYISETDYERVHSSPITLRKGVLDTLTGKFEPYVNYILDEAVSLYGFTEDQLLTGGLQIYTEMDPKVQQAAEDVYKDNRYFPQGKADQIVQSGMAIIDQHNGGIRGLVGNRGQTVFRAFDHATQLKRQPGSSIKPLAVYGPALEKGYTPNSLLYDGPLNINGYSPKDYDFQNRGQVTMENALQNSWNIPAVWLLNKIGLDAGMSFAQRAGLPLTKNDRTLSLALGGLSAGVSPLQMAQAYGAFANLGTMNKAYAIDKITSANGYVFAQAKPESVQVTDPQNAYTMTKLLENVVNNGTGKNAFLGRPTAGKTGSVELPHTQEFSGVAKGAKDVWFVGYTPDLTAAVWMGYDKTDRNHYLTISGGSGPAVVFHEVFSRALKDTPVQEFKIPQGYQDPWKPSSSDIFGNQRGPGNNKNASSLRDQLLRRFGLDANRITPDQKQDQKPKGKGKKG